MNKLICNTTIFDPIHSRFRFFIRILSKNRSSFASIKNIKRIGIFENSKKKKICVFDEKLIREGCVDEF